MIFETEGNTGEFVELVISGLEYIGPKELTQYFIKDTKMAFGLNNDITVTVVMGRRLLGTVLTTYIPTILLIIISYFSNLFKPFFFEATVVVNLTVMLVLVTMLIS